MKCGPRLSVKQIQIQPVTLTLRPTFAQTLTFGAGGGGTYAGGGGGGGGASLGGGTSLGGGGGGGGGSASLR